MEPEEEEEEREDAINQIWDGFMATLAASDFDNSNEIVDAFTENMGQIQEMSLEDFGQFVETLTDEQFMTVEGGKLYHRGEDFAKLVSEVFNIIRKQANPSERGRLMHIYELWAETREQSRKMEARSSQLALIERSIESLAKISIMLGAPSTERGKSTLLVLAYQRRRTEELRRRYEIGNGTKPEDPKIVTPIGETLAELCRERYAAVTDR